MIYPDGVVVRDDATYMIVNGKACEFATPRVLKSWRVSPIRGEVDNPRGNLIGFRNGTLIKHYKDGRMYLVSGGKRREIATPDFFKTYGFRKRDVVTVSSYELNLHEAGEDIN